MQVFAKGDRGNEVVDIQVKLSKLGYDLGIDGADGSFGDITENAVKDFQYSRSLGATGVVNEETWRSLVEAAYELGDRLLYLRTPYFKGDDVRELQLALNTIGFNTGSVDGIYGRSTERAVREFQKNYGLTRDGIFGPSMLKALKNLSHILSGKTSHVFPDPQRDKSSSISAFRGVRVGIGLSSNDKSVIIDRDSEAVIDVVYDLGMRLGNLLELLGAEVLFENSKEPDLFVVFEMNYSNDPSVKGSTVCYGDEGKNVEAKSRELAELVQREIVQTLSTYDNGICSCSVSVEFTTTVPSIIIKPLYITNHLERYSLSTEIFRQKICGYIK
ncbi:MAG: peptidoglycan-binding protein [Rubrobacteridae bacterium]|nr:peptidoglycan-binding protein [Rubrobacteridae bacterium]